MESASKAARLQGHSNRRRAASMRGQIQIPCRPRPTTAEQRGSCRSSDGAGRALLARLRGRDCFIVETRDNTIYCAPAETSCMLAEPSAAAAARSDIWSRKRERATTTGVPRRRRRRRYRGGGGLLNTLCPGRRMRQTRLGHVFYYLAPAAA